MTQLCDNFDCSVFDLPLLKKKCHRKVKILSQRRENGIILEIGQKNTT